MDEKDCLNCGESFNPDGSIYDDICDDCAGEQEGG